MTGPEKSEDRRALHVQPFAADVKLLAGLGLGEAFKKHVLEHPAVSEPGQALCSREKQYADIFSEGRVPGCYIIYEWPLDVEPAELAFDFVRPLVFFVPGPPVPEPSDEIRLIAEAMSARIRTFRRMLVEGALIAHGMFESTGTFGPIHRQQWARSDVFIDVKNGDFIRKVAHKSVVQWSGVVLEEFHVNSLEHDDLRRSAAASVSKLTAAQASIEAAFRALWPSGVPETLPAQVRDQMIIDWQKKNPGHAVVSPRTIRRCLGKLHT